MPKKVFVLEFYTWYNDERKEETTGLLVLVLVHAAYIGSNPPLFPPVYP